MGSNLFYSIDLPEQGALSRFRFLHRLTLMTETQHPTSDPPETTPLSLVEFVGALNNTKICPDGHNPIFRFNSCKVPLTNSAAQSFLPANTTDPGPLYPCVKNQEASRDTSASWISATQNPAHPVPTSLMTPAPRQPTPENDTTALDQNKPKPTNQNEAV